MINSFIIDGAVIFLRAFDRGRHKNLLHEVAVSVLLSISIASGALMLRSCRLANLSVGLSVCLSGKCIVANG